LGSSNLKIDQDAPVASEKRLQDVVFEPILDAERARRVVSARAIEEAGGLPADDVIAAIKGFGLSVESADDPWFTEEEARVFIALAELGALWPRDTYLQVSRVYGQALATIARAEVQSAVRNVEDLATTQTVRELREGMEALLPLADPILQGVHRRWVEHELAQASVFAVEDAGAEARGAVHVALLFVDIKNFTSFVDTAGDRAGIDAIEQFDEIVQEEHGPNGQVVKALGDGFMLVYPNGADAVAAGHAMLRRMPREHGPALHASVHEGLSLHRGGDYFGRSVNLAARLLGLSGTDELLGTRAVVDTTGERFEWEPRATTHIRGFKDPIEIFRLVGPR
jgi:adenylate cyclase